MASLGTSRAPNIAKTSTSDQTIDGPNWKMAASPAVRNNSTPVAIQTIWASSRRDCVPSVVTSGSRARAAAAVAAAASPGRPT